MQVQWENVVSLDGRQPVHKHSYPSVSVPWVEINCLLRVQSFLNGIPQQSRDPAELVLSVPPPLSMSMSLLRSLKSYSYSPTTLSTYPSGKTSNMNLV